MSCVKPEFPEQALSFFESVLVTLERWSRGEHPMRGYNVIDDPGNRALKAPDVVKTLAWMLPKAQAAYRDLSEFLHVYSPPLGDPKWCSTPTAPAATAEPSDDQSAAAKYYAENPSMALAAWNRQMDSARAASLAPREPLTEEQVFQALASITHEVPVRLPPGWRKFAAVIQRDCAEAWGVAITEAAHGIAASPAGAEGEES